MPRAVFKTEEGTVAFFCLSYALAIVAGIYTGTSVAGEHATVFDEVALSVLYTGVFSVFVRLTLIEFVRHWQHTRR